mmetsp:Transcript_62649/g.186732  ORF Transcript_62649/g.186732 Transcript_62649/m.186732 type:complete len:95 (+) Transcript_62649:93-377(+)
MALFVEWGSLKAPQRGRFTSQVGCNAALRVESSQSESCARQAVGGAGNRFLAGACATHLAFGFGSGRDCASSETAAHIFPCPFFPCFVPCWYAC